MFITSRKEEVLKAAAAKISGETGNRVLYHAADVRDPEAVKKAFDALVAEAGLPDIVINNACVRTRPPPSGAEPTRSRVLSGGDAGSFRPQGRQLYHAI